MSRSRCWVLCVGLVLTAIGNYEHRAQAQAQAVALPTTTIWTDRGEPARDMVEGLHRFFDRATTASQKGREAKWRRDGSSADKYVASIAENRARFARMIASRGASAPVRRGTPMLGGEESAVLVRRRDLVVQAVTWSVADGITAEGLLVENPRVEPRASVVVIGDTEQPPEALVGLSSGLPPGSQVARLLADAGCKVLVVTLIDRTSEFSGSPMVRFTNLPHREWIYRMAYETGWHLIGMEVDAVRAGIDLLTSTTAGQTRSRSPIGVAGWGQGGLTALYAAAVDTRIDAAWVAGYFGPREGLASEPIDRNVWGLLDEFGDAEIASLIHPRALLVEACRAGEVAGPPAPKDGRNDAASGRIITPAVEETRREVERAKAMGASPSLLASSADRVWNERDEGRRGFLKAMGLDGDFSGQGASGSEPGAGAGPTINPRNRMRRLVEGLVAATQARLRTSELRRSEKWSKADASSPARWEETTRAFRDEFWAELIGKLPPASVPLKPRSVKLFDEPHWVGYGVELPVFPDVVASGVYLLPKDLKPGEKRPVVVCQHGLEGTPDPIVNPRNQSVYHSYGARLADRGYIVYAPQNPYIGQDRFRALVRKAHPLKQSLYSVIVRQHERTLEWLASRPEVDPARIAFYGLSYGGKTAMRIPAILPGYCLSICSADFNEWVRKNTDIDRRYSYLYTLEYDMYEWNLAEGFNYSEMAGLIAPRPFMVERGHDDGVAPDEWVFQEYAKVKRLYDKLGLGDRVGLALFNGGHMIDGKETFPFLDRHLKWTPRQP